MLLDYLDMKSTSRVYSSNTTFSRMEPNRMAFQISGSDSWASQSSNHSKECLQCLQN